MKVKTMDNKEFIRQLAILLDFDPMYINTDGDYVRYLILERAETLFEIEKTYNEMSAIQQKMNQKVDLIHQKWHQKRGVIITAQLAAKK